MGALLGVAKLEVDAVMRYFKTERNRTRTFNGF
jgi:hypothetical protein